jgi:tetratricopeptide (TPR) repeat protein
MAAAEPSNSPRLIRVYCPVHKVGFTAAGATIECSSQKHTLARSFPHDSFWEYCCDCQHYWPLDAARGNTASGECPACERQIVRRFICQDCQVISVESDDPGRRKLFSISPQGLPDPACPGCLSRSSSSGLDHDCSDFGALFVTQRPACPFCDDALEMPPNFPCSVADYVEKLRVPTTVLQFEAASNLLTQSASGHYILIEKVRGYALPIVIPKATKLSSKQDYYNTYYELFNCDNPAPGEVVVLSPAIVEKTEGGWQLREAGLIDIKPDPSAQPAASTARVQVPCVLCGVLGEAGRAFCKNCGGPMLGQQMADAVVTPPQASAYATEAPAHNSDIALHRFEEDLSHQNVVSASGSASALRGKGILVGVVAVGFVAVVIAIGVISKSGVLPGGELSVEKKLDRAISAGNLFNPSNENAHDLYYELKSSGANDEVLRGYREKLTPTLTPRGYQLTAKLMQIGYDEPHFTEWLEAAKRLDWAQELNPGNSFIAARAAYCRGRAAYLQKEHDDAIKWWTSAADLDKSWVLPVNGLGMVYTAKKNWGTARSYFFQAVQRDANWPFPEENIGNTYLFTKDYATAKEFYRKAIAKAPNWAKPHIHLADIAFLERDYATAVSEFEAALSENAIGLKDLEPANAQKRLAKARQKLFETQGY